MSEPNKTKSAARDVRTKRELFKTAQARISCAHFKAGDFLSVEYFGQGSEGVHYFSCWIPNSNSGVAVYPEHHLTSFCL